MTKERSATRVDYYDGVERMTTPLAVLQKLAERSSLTPDSAKLILVMVGLPARGKSFISHKLLDFLNWSGMRTQIFNAGQKRRPKTMLAVILEERLCSLMYAPSQSSGHDASTCLASS